MFVAIGLVVFVALPVTAILLTQRVPSDPGVGIGAKVVVARGSTHGYEYKIVAYASRGGNVCLSLHAHKRLRLLGAVDGGECSVPKPNDVTIGAVSGRDVIFANGQVTKAAVAVRLDLKNKRVIRLQPLTGKGRFAVNFFLTVLPSGVSLKDVIVASAVAADGRVIAQQRTG
jgi:hypothetical protein